MTEVRPIPTGIRDIKFIAFVNFLFTLLWLETVFYPLVAFWAQVTVPLLVVFWNGMNLFIWIRREPLSRARAREEQK
jgi:hypothetical protein